jgi:hypothetical protein
MMKNDYAADRRHFLGALGAGVALASFLPLGSLAIAAEKVRVPGGMQRDLPEDSGRYPRAVFDVPTPFNLDDLLGYQYARMKAMQSLAGRTAYVAILTRHQLCLPGVPPRPIVNELELFRMFMERLPEGSPGAGEGGAVQRSLFTRLFLDPRTNTPVREIKNPFSEARIELNDTLFALTLPVKFEKARTVRAINEAEQPYMRFPPFVDFISLAIRSGDGPHQPSLDTSAWRANENELNDRARADVMAHYSYTALSKAGLFDWSGYKNEDPAQIVTSKTGLKVNRVEDLPQIVRDTIVAKYPERV